MPTKLPTVTTYSLTPRIGSKGFGLAVLSALLPKLPMPLNMQMQEFLDEVAPEEEGDAEQPMERIAIKVPDLQWSIDFRCRVEQDGTWEKFDRRVERALELLNNRIADLREQGHI